MAKGGKNPDVLQQSERARIHLLALFVSFSDDSFTFQTMIMPTIKWSLDSSHSKIQFKVKHLMITHVTGSIDEFSINASAEDEKFTHLQLAFTGKMKSLNTGNHQRDIHLKSVDFFDADHHPEIRFISSKVDSMDINGNFMLHGDLTIKDTTVNIPVKVEFGGLAKDPWGETKAGFTIIASINRKDFGLHWNTMLESGGVLVSDEVKITGEIELVRDK
jgi:polyisoprenoid-binding protein YceI